MSRWETLDAVLVSSVAQYGTKWKKVVKNLPADISVSAARNRYARIQQGRDRPMLCKKRPERTNYCATCKMPKRGHCWVLCQPFGASFEGVDYGGKDTLATGRLYTDTNEDVSWQEGGTFPYEDKGSTTKEDIGEDTQEDTNEDIREETKEDTKEATKEGTLPSPEAEAPCVWHLSDIFEDNDVLGHLRDCNRDDMSQLSIECMSLPEILDGISEVGTLQVELQDVQAAGESHVQALEPPLIASQDMPSQFLETEEMQYWQGIVRSMQDNNERISKLEQSLADACAEIRALQRIHAHHTAHDPEPGHLQRKRFLTTQQRRIVMDAYNRNDRPSTEERDELARQCVLPVHVVNNWFSNRRKREKSKANANNAWIALK